MTIINATQDDSIKFLQYDRIANTGPTNLTSLHYAGEGLNLARKLKRTGWVIRFLHHSGNIMFNMGNYSGALQYYLQEEKIVDSIGYHNSMAGIYNGIGNVYSAMGNYDKAMEYYSRGLGTVISLGYGNRPDACTFYNNLGSVLFATGDYSKAIENYKKSLAIAKTEPYYYGMANAYSGLGEIHCAEGELDKSLEYYEKAIQAFMAAGSMEQRVAGIKISIGKIYLLQNKPALAIIRFDESIALIKEDRVDEVLQNAYLGLSEAYSMLNNYEKAYEFHIQCARIRDTLFNMESSRQITEMQTKYETEKKDKENELLRKEKQLKISEIARQRIVIIFITIALALIGIIAFFIYRSYRIKRKANVALKQKNNLITIQKGEIEKQKALIEDKNRDITDSIQYALRIQQAILPSDELVKKFFPQSFILYKPKDIICGDFYFFSKVNQYIIFAVADCTGHGVPGALMSMIGNDLLNDIVNDQKITTSAMALEELDTKLMNILNPKGRHTIVKDGLPAETSVKDGMDIAFCAFNTITNELQYAGAKRPLFLIHNHEITEYKPDSRPIGESGRKKDRFTNHTIIPIPGDMLYLFTDGFADQIGGPTSKKIMTKGLKELLLNIHGNSPDEQKNFLTEYFENWKGSDEQLDDVTVVGIRV